MRTKTIIIICLICLEYFNSKAQHSYFDWVKNVSTPIISSTVDNENNIYIIGIVDFKIYFAKYDSSGTKIWEKEIIDQSSIDGISISVDANKNIVISGSITNTAYFDSDSITAFHNNGHNPFLAKYENNGNLLWVKNIGHISSFVGPYCAHGFQSKIDKLNNIYFFGNFAGDTLFLEDTTILGHNMSYYSKFSPDGQLLWIKTIRADLSYSMAIDNSNNFLLTGSSYDTLIIENDTIPKNKFFLIKINEFGICQWAKTIDARINQLSSSLICDELNNIYFTGNFTRIMHFENDSLIGNGPYNPNNSNFYCSDIFIAKYNSSGNFIWAKKAGGLNGDNSFSITLNQNSIYIFGKFDRKAYFESDSLTSSNQNINYFVANYSIDGHLTWLKQIRTNYYVDNTNYFYNLISMQSNLYLTGLFPDSTYFDSIVMPNSGNFMAKINDTFNSINIYNFTNDFISVYPNPSNSILYIINQVDINVSIELINIRGQIEDTYNFNKKNNFINIDKLSNGVYILRMKSSEMICNVKFIKN